MMLLSSHLQPSPSTSSLSSNHSASPNVTSSAPSSARGETGALQKDSFYNVIHCRPLADISIQSDSRGGSRQRFSWTRRTRGLNLLTFQWHDVLSNHRSEVSEVRRQPGIHVGRGGDGKKQWGERVEWKVRDWKIERIQNELRWKMKWAETWRQMLLKETWSQWKCKRE